MPIPNQETIEVAVQRPKKVIPTEKYVLKEGVGSHMDHSAGPGEAVLMKAGDIIELTAAQALQFKDKFKPMSQVLAESEVARRTSEIADALKKGSDKKAKEEQKRLKEEALKDLAAEQAKLAKESEDADTGEGEDDDDDGEEGVKTDTNEDASEGTEKSEAVSSPAKDADLKAAPKIRQGTNSPAQVKTVAKKAS